ncbi:transglutaminase domain-containing protein [Haliangium sp.]|uniref:transglutaminase-like domain-containing protein n=1 Tax=Haliangium sp. TaxID=2663208 RepID=UPI003D0F307E
MFTAPRPHRATRPAPRLASGLIAITAVACALAWSAWGQGNPGPRVLHRDLPPPENADSAAAGGAQTVFGPSPREGQNPSAFAYGSKILPAPSAGSDPREDEPVHGRGGFAVDRLTESTPDSGTGSDDTLQYVTVFNPSVLPFKRMSALDAVRPDYTLYSAGAGVMRDLPVGGAPSPDRDLFWGELMIELTPGRDVAIPSVAPDMRIMSYEVEPRTVLTFSKDAGDNYFVRSDENDARGRYRLRFMADASALYFAPRLPSNIPVHEVARRAPPGLFQPVPENLRGAVREVHSRLGISPDTPVRRAVNKLVSYFRAFEPGPLKRQSGDLYRDLVYSQRGVCRHRSFAFMVTANGLGLPTRYVVNEAHAWVEVWVPESDWMRIDLGGAALRMVVDNAEDKSLYQPRGEDPFAKPDVYQNNYTQLEGDIQGLSDDQRAEARQRGAGTGGTESFSPDPASGDGGGGSGSDLEIAPGSELPEVAPEVMDNKQPTQLVLTQVDREGFRGESIAVAGRLSSAGEGVGGQRVDIYLAPVGAAGAGATLVGRTVSEPDGGFSAYVQIPSELAPQDYEVYVTTPGDSRYAPGLSD